MKGHLTTLAFVERIAPLTYLFLALLSLYEIDMFVGARYAITCTRIRHNITVIGCLPEGLQSKLITVGSWWFP